MSVALAIDGLTKRYGHVVAVDDLSFAAPRGRILGFLGPNGAGKTTTLRIALGLVKPTIGRVSVLGQDDPARVRSRIGFLPEERGLYRRMTPLSAIVFLAGLKGMKAAEARRKAVGLLESQGLGEARHRQIRLLSKGMAQKVQLLSAIVHEPELVILDEPFSGLDPVNQLSLETLIRAIAAGGTTVIFSTHVMQHAERLCDQVVLMAAGRKVFDGAVDVARKVAPRSVVLEGVFGADALGGLTGLHGVTAERLDGGALRIVATLDPSVPAQVVLAEVFAKRLPIDRFELREPNLHEAFILLTASSREPGLAP